MIDRCSAAGCKGLPAGGRGLLLMDALSMHFDLPLWGVSDSTPIESSGGYSIAGQSKFLKKPKTRKKREKREKGGTMVMAAEIKRPGRRLIFALAFFPKAREILVCPARRGAARDKRGGEPKIPAARA